MSLKTWLMPSVSEWLLSEQRQVRLRARAEQARVAKGEPHQVHYFHQVDDPYSALMVQCLPTLLKRYGLTLVAHVVGPPSAAAAPDRERLVAYSRVDAQLLARHVGLTFTDPGAQPTPQALDQATAQWVAAAEAGRFVAVAATVSEALWSDQGSDLSLPQGLPTASEQQVQEHLAQAAALRQKLGHYLGATLYYAGEWYWGVDRLYHLERRLQALGVQKPGVSDVMFAPAPDLQSPIALDQPPVVDFYLSLRSPYSAIVAPRIFELGRLTGASIKLRYVLPMVMRGLPVPSEKRRYISWDATREARARGIAFGRINDPVGRPAERGLALIPLAERQGKGQAYVLAFMHAVWAEGIDAGSDKGLRLIAERAGLTWAEAQDALQDPQWRSTAEANRQEMLDLGVWGVPSFRVGSTVVWGQDRLWAVQNAILASQAQNN